MATTVNRPVAVLDMQDNFSEREVGVTHPDVSSHIRLRDNGDIEIITGEGLGIILNRKNRTLSFIADRISFLTQDTAQSLRWNSLAFNNKATVYSEPTFSALNQDELSNLYAGADAFF